MTELPKTRLPLRSRGKRSWLLLISIILFFTLAPLLEGHKIGGLLLLLNFYITLVAATSELAEKRALFWSAIPIAFASMILLLASHYYSTWLLAFASDLVLTAFLMLVSISLFIYLGQRGQMSRDRLLISVSLYFLLGLTWFALYNLISTIEPGSFAEAGKPLIGDNTHWSTMLYFSLVTLTTLGYGDITAIKPFARMVATLEASAGVLYIAITVARLVSSSSAAKEHEH